MARQRKNADFSSKAEKKMRKKYKFMEDAMREQEAQAMREQEWRTQDAAAAKGRLNGRGHVECFYDDGNSPLGGPPSRISCVARCALPWRACSTACPAAVV